MAWYKQKTIEGDFEAEGYPDFKFTAVDVNSLLYGELEDLMALRNKATASDEASSDLIKELLHRLVIDWNLTDPETDEPLAPPAKDETTFRRLPMSFINHMITKILGEVEKEAVPPENGS